jgi:hypothetical protein
VLLVPLDGPINTGNLLKLFWHMQFDNEKA